MTRRGPRRPAEPAVMGAAEAADALGVRQQNLRRQVGLPEPYQTVRATTLWRVTDIEEFARSRIARDRRKREARDELAAAA